MRGSVDSRVVEMHFDNKDFMNKISETIAALEELNKQIASINGTHGLDNLSGSNAGSDLANVSDAVGNIEQRFSTLGIVGMTVIQRLTNAGINMALKVGSGIKAAENQIIQGGFGRAEKLEQAKFLLEGLGADVEGIMGRVNEAVDGTAYGLDEAAKASASFYASGIKDLDKMEATLKSVSGVAALVGSDYSSMAEIFTTVAGQGKLMTMQLRQLESRGLNAAAYLAEYFGTTEEAVRDMVTKGEVSFEDFTAAMSRFADHAKDANKTFSGAMANMKTSLSRLGEAFITPAMEAAIPLFNGLREAISAFTTKLKEDVPGHNGLVKQFALTVDYLGTKLGVLFRLLNGKTFSSEELENLEEKGYFGLLKMAEAARTTHSVFSDLGLSVSRLGEIALNAFEIMGEAFKEVFPEATFNNFKAFITAFNNSITKFYLAHRFLDGFRNVMVGVFSLFKAGYNIVSGIVKVFVSLIKAITGLTGKTMSLSEGFMNFSKALSNVTGALGIFDLLVSVIDGAGKVIGKAFDTIFKGFSKFISTIGQSVSGIDNVNESLTMLGLIWAGLFGGQMFGKATYGLKHFGQVLFGVKDVFETFKETIKKFPDKFNSLTVALTNSLNNMTAKVQSETLRNIALSVLALAVALKILSEIDNEGLARGLGGVTVVLGELVGVIAIITKIAGGGEFAKSLKGIYAMNSVTTSLIKIGAAMILMATALKMIAELDPKQLATGLAGMTIMLAAVLGFVLVLDKYQKVSADPKVGIMMMAIAIALNTMAKAVTSLSSLKPAELTKGLGGVIVIMTAIFGFMAAISEMGVSSGGGMVAAGIGMIAIATAINILTPALQKLGSMSLEQLAKGLSAIAIAMVSMAAVSQSMNASGAAGMLLMSVAISTLGTTIERLGSLDIATIAKGLGTIIVAIAALGAAAIILAPASAALLALGGAMILVSASFAIFGAGLIMIGAGLVSISSGIMSFASVTSTSLSIFINTIKMILLELISLIPSIAAALAEGFITFLEQIAELAPRFKEAAGKIIANLLEVFEENAPRIIKTGIRFILNLLSGLEEAMPKITEKAVGVITGFINGISENMDKIVQAGFNLVINFINGLANGIRDNTEAVRTAIWNLCDAILDAFMSFFGIHSPSTVMEAQGTNLVLGLINGIRNNIGLAGETILKGIQSIPGNIKKKVSAFLSSGKSLMKNFLSGLKTKKNEIKDKFTAGVETAKTKLKGTSLYSTGKNLIQGFLNGLNALKDKVSSFWNWLSDKAKKIIEKKNEIKSPSKVYFRYGKYIMQGLINGLEELKDKPVGVLAELSDSMNDAVAAACDEMSTYGDFNPTITPVLDLSEVKRNAGSISSMFGDESVTLASSIGQNDIQNIQSNNLMNQLLSKMDKIMSSDNSNSANITNNFTVNGSEDPEQFVNTFVRTLDREMKMRAV